ncbi:hypothetical protein L1887_58821 [Cichorium endivia]|nr:hypothetical protein L1887_58821 [Cichorium endivia]
MIAVLVEGSAEIYRKIRKRNPHINESEERIFDVRASFNQSLMVSSGNVGIDLRSGFISGIVGRMKWDEALVDIASVTGRRLGRSGSGRLARKSLLW